MNRPVLTAAAALTGLLAGSAVAQTQRDYAAIYGVRSGAAVDLQTQQDVTTTVSTGTAGRYAKPQPGAEPRPGTPAPVSPGTGRGFGYSDYGTVSGGYPAYGSTDFPAQQADAEEPAETEEQAPAQEGGQQADAGEAFGVSEGFFFDNYTSGTGFGVYGGEAVTSGQPPALVLPSAGNRALELGYPTGPASAPAAPVEPEG